MWNFLFLLIFYLISYGSSVPDDKEIRIATYTYHTNDRLENLLPFEKLLATRYGAKIETRSYATVEQLITAMEKKEVDIVFISTAGYLAYIRQANDYQIAGTLVIDQPSESSYKAIIAASKKSGVQNWNDLAERSRNLKFALVSENSTSGYLFPFLRLQQEQLTPLQDHFEKVTFTKDHSKSLAAILSGEYDIAAFGQNDLWGIPEVENLINILWVSPEIPLGPVLVRNELDPAFSREIEELLLQLHHDHPVVFEAIKAGWIEAQNATHFQKVSNSYYLDLLM